MPDQSKWTESFSTVNGVRLHIAEQGTGPCIVLLHGFPQFWYSWHHQIPALAEAGYKVVAPDLRGFNLSEKPRGVYRYRIEEVVEDIAALIRLKGNGKAVVIGHDIGGIVAWYTAMMKPGLVSKLIILNCPHPAIFARDIWSFTQMRKSFYCVLHRLPFLPELLWRAFNCALVRYALRAHSASKDAFPRGDIEKFIEAAKKPGALRSAINYYRAMRVPEGSKEWVAKSKPIDIPTLVLWGKQERILIPKLLEGMEPWVKNLRVEIIENAAHWIQEDAPEEVNRLIIDFLRAS